MNTSEKRIIGLLLICISILALSVAFCQVVPLGYADFPCFEKFIFLENVKPDTRIIYCISFWSYRAISGGGVYDSGASKQDEIKTDDFVFRRNKDVLYVNNETINPGEIYKKTHWAASINPWLIFTQRFEIKNEGVESKNAESPVDVLYISGDVYEGWMPNPLGLIMLGSGVWLLAESWGNKKQETD